MSGPRLGALSNNRWSCGNIVLSGWLRWEDSDHRLPEGRSCRWITTGNANGKLMGSLLAPTPPPPMPPGGRLSIRSQLLSLLFGFSEIISQQPLTRGSSFGSNHVSDITKYARWEIRSVLYFCPTSRNGWYVRLQNPAWHIVRWFDHQHVCHHVRLSAIPASRWFRAFTRFGIVSRCSANEFYTVGYQNTLDVEHLHPWIRISYFIVLKIQPIFEAQFWEYSCTASWSKG